MIEQARKIFDSYDPEPRFSGRKSTQRFGASLRERLMLAMERKKIQKDKHSLFNKKENDLGDDGLYT